MNIPTETDWAHHPDDLDAACAKKNFFGKTRDQAVELFVVNALTYQEDIMFMPEPCFCFYVHSYIDYLMSGLSKGDSDGASCFFGIVEVRKDDILRGPSELMTRVAALLRRLAERQAWYEAQPDIYGQFKERSEACLRLMGESNNSVTCNVVSKRMKKILAQSFVVALAGMWLIYPYRHQSSVDQAFWLSPLLAILGGTCLRVVIRSEQTLRLPVKFGTLAKDECPNAWPYCQFAYAWLGWLGIQGAIMLWI
jgi:hypothetical protein